MRLQWGAIQDSVTHAPETPNKMLKYDPKNDHFDVWLMTVVQRPSQQTQKASHHVLWECCCCVHGSVCSAGENRGKRAHTCECCAEGGPWLRIVFNRWESGGMREGVCMCVCAAGVCSSSVCQQVNSPFILAASRTSAKMTGHTPLFTHSLSPYLFINCLYLSAHLWLYIICFCPFFSLHLFASSIWQAFSLTFFFFVCWIHCNMGAQLWSLSAVYPSLLGSRTVTWQPVNPPDCVSASLSTLGSGLQKKTEMVKVKEVLKQILQVIWLASETCPTPLCYITASLSLKHTHSLHYLCRASYI